MKEPNLPKSAENQVNKAGEKPEDQHNLTKLPRFTSRLEKMWSLKD